MPTQISSETEKPKVYMSPLRAETGPLARERVYILIST